MHSYKDVLDGISATDKIVYKQAQEYLATLAKPIGSLGKLEEIAAQISAITGAVAPVCDKRCVIVAAADNGVVAENVSCSPQWVTATQTINIASGITGVGVLAKQFNTELMVADVGVNADISHPNLIDKKIRKSTGNITKEPALTHEQAIRAIEVGIELVQTAHEQGYKLVGVGEMGIGNTTTSSAVLCGLLNLRGDEAVQAVGRGGGLNDEFYQNKINAIKTALKLHNPDKSDPVDILEKVGGLDLCAMTGIYIGCAYYKIPVVIDGFISVVAALCAVRLNPLIREYVVPSHQSFEQGYMLAINALQLSPCLNLGMRLGEGSGCPIMFGVIDGALSIMKNMATFEQASINDDYLKRTKNIKF